MPPPTTLLAFCAVFMCSPAWASNVVAKRENVWPTRTVDVIICDAQAVKRLGGSVCSPQAPNQEEPQRGARLAADDASLVRRTMDLWNLRYKQNIRLREVRTPGATSTIVFRTSSRENRCSTQKIGYVRSQPFKYISLGRRCNPRLAPNGTNVGTVAHEVLHAVGVYHEQQRSDRSQMATVRKKRAKGHQWKKTCNPGQERCGHAEAQAKPLGRYDFGSVMHYSVRPDKAKLTPAGKKRLKEQNLRMAQVGQRIWLSRADERGLRQLYPPR